MEDLKSAPVLVPMDDVWGVERRMEDIVGIQVGKSAAGKNPSTTNELIIDD